jgi:hypothetical protein
VGAADSHFEVDHQILLMPCGGELSLDPTLNWPSNLMDSPEKISELELLFCRGS